MKTFEELGVASTLLKAIQEMGFVSPMPVQEEVIPFLLGEDNDVIALAQTGTGKTAAYGLPILQKIKKENVYPQALILSPTRELCLQIADDLKDYSKHMEQLKVLAVYGGSSIESQIKSLRRGVHIVVATPGRLLDLMRRKRVDLSLIHNVVLDEADEMLNMGFTEDLNAILAAIPESRNMLLFSATMPQGISGITKKYMRNPKEIVIGRKNEGNENIKHISYMIQARDKYSALKRIADFFPNIYGIVFCRTRKETQDIADKLIQDGYSADALHGDLSQAQRDYVMQKFRKKTIQLLVATDVAARGLDVDDLTHVVNYGLPDDIESYTHRSGRTGRAGKTGISIAICHTREKGKLRNIERTINKKFEKGELPSGKAICEKQLFNLVDQIEKVKVDEKEIKDLMPPIFRKLEWLDKEDIIKRIVSLEFNRMIDYYKDAKEIQVVNDNSRDRGDRFDRADRGDRRERRDRGSRNGGAEKGYSRFFINFGEMDGMSPTDLIAIVNRCLGGHADIGRIDLHEKFSFFEVEEKETSNVLTKMNNFELEGRLLSVEQAQERNSRSQRTDRIRGGSRSKYAKEGNSRSRNRSDRGEKPWRKKEGYNHDRFSNKKKNY